MRHYVQRSNGAYETPNVNYIRIYSLQKELKELRKSERQLSRGNYSEMMDKELEKMIEKRFDLRQKQLDLEQQYYKKFKAVLPMKKVAKLPQIERAFRTALLKKMKEQRKGKK